MSRCRRIVRILADRGITLLELILAVTMFGLFAAAIHETVLVGLRAVNATDERENVRQQLSNALDRFTREARMATVVDTAQATRFTFDADFDGDGDSEGNEVDIDYRQQTGVLNRDQGTTSITLVPDLTSIEFDYIDVNGADMTPPVSAPSRPDIRVVQVNITAKDDDESISISAAVFLTNM